MTDDDDKLLLAVEALTRPRTSKVVQSKNGIECISPINLPPLLETLDTMIRETMGGSAGGTLKFEQNILDTDALERFVRINSLVSEWARRVGSVIHKPSTSRTLVAWFLAYRQKPRTYEEDKFFVSKLWRWANEIEEKADPWKVADLPDACPECGEEYWFSPKTRERYLRPLIVRYKEGDTMLENAEAMCRFCDKKFGVRELSYELAQLREALGASA